MKNDGKEAESAFVQHWESVGHIERLRDKKDLMGLNGGRQIADFVKPADFIVSSPDTALHYAEVKSTIDRTKFTFNKIRPGQHIAALKSVQRGDGAYLFYIFSYAAGTWYKMTAHHYRGLLDDGRRSVDFQELPLWHK